MPFLRPPCCPNCSGPVRLEALWKCIRTDRGNFPVDAVGLRCPTCNVPLRVLSGSAPWRVFGVQIALLVLSGLIADHFVAIALLTKSQWIAVPLLSILVGAGLSYWLAPRLVTLRRPIGGEEIAFPLDSK